MDRSGRQWDLTKILWVSCFSYFSFMTYLFLKVFPCFWYFTIFGLFIQLGKHEMTKCKIFKYLFNLCVNDSFFKLCKYYLESNYSEAWRQCPSLNFNFFYTSLKTNVVWVGRRSPRFLKVFLSSLSVLQIATFPIFAQQTWKDEM